MSTKTTTENPFVPAHRNEAQKLMDGIYATGNEKKQQTWDDLTGLYQSLMNAIVTANSETIKMLRIEGILSFIEDKAATKVAINGLENDIKAFTNELNNIYNLHKGRTGPVNMEGDLTICFSIFENYMAFQTRYHAVIIPTVELIAEQCSIAAKRMTEYVATHSQEQVQADLQDPNVVSDIEVKQVHVDIETIKN